MKIVIVYQYYQDATAPGHSLMYEFAQFMARKGHDVWVVAGQASYMAAEDPAATLRDRMLKTTLDGPVHVVRTFSSRNQHSSYAARVMSYFSFAASCVLGLLRAGRPDVVLASSPQIFQAVSARVVAKAWRSRFVFEVRDLWPESMVELGALSNPTIIRITRMLEEWLYTSADRIVALTNGIKSSIVRRGWNAAKIDVLPCGADATLLTSPADSRDATRLAYGWGDRTVVLYLGSLGVANNIYVILRAASRLRHREDIVFVLVGDGFERSALMAEAARLGLANVMFPPAVAKGLVHRFLSASDIGVVTLQDIPVFGGAIPTKLIEYMFVGLPVLCGVRGEAAEIVTAGQCGLLFEPNSDEALAAQLVWMLENPAQATAMGANGTAHAKAHFDSETRNARLAAACEGRP